MSKKIKKVKNKTLYSVTKIKRLKEKADKLDISGPVHIIEVAQRQSREERELVWVEFLAANKNGIPVVFLDSFTTSDFKTYVRKVCANMRIYEDVAFIQFTSGSTGTPKACQWTNARLIYDAEYEMKIFGVSRNTRVVDVLSPASGFILKHFFMACVAGSQFIFIENSSDYKLLLQRFIKEKVDFVAMSNMHWLKIGTALQKSKLKWPLKIAVSTGGPINSEALTALLSRTKCKLFNDYGSAELGSCTFLDSGSIKEKPDSVGQAKSWMKLKVVDGQKGSECLPFEEGEVIIEIRKKFLEKMYPGIQFPFRTGDLGYKDTKGDLFIIGRKDELLKVSGYRITPLQIESAYNRYISCVFGVPTEVKGNYDIAIVFETNETIAKAKTYVKKTDPPINIFCRPKYVFAAAKLARTFSGKIDRLKIKKEYLLKIKNMQKSRRNDARPDFSKTGTEKTIEKIWGELLGSDDLSIQDNFFHIGGDSLKAMQCASRVNAEFGIFFPIVEIFKNPTIKEMAKRIETISQLKKKH